MNRAARRLVVLIALLLSPVVLPAGAQAAVTSSSITAPADASMPFFDSLDGKGPYAITVTGTVNTSAVASDKVDIICQRRGEALTAATSPSVAATGVSIVAAGATRTFSVAIDSTVAALRTPCRLRAIPENAEATFNQAAFVAGPTVFPSGLRDLRETNLANPNIATLYDVDAYSVTPGRTSTGHIESFGACGLYDARPLDPSVGPEVAALNVFSCAGFADDVADETAGTTSEIDVDLHNAYTGAMAALGSGGLPGVAGRPALTRTATRDPLTGALHITEGSDIVRCATTPASGYPFATSADCGGFVPTGLRIERTVDTSFDGRVVTMHDRWTSTDGGEHVLKLLLETDMQPQTPAQKYGVSLPWTAPDLSAYAGGTVFSGPPTAPASILVASDRTVPAGDLAHPTGAVSFSSAPKIVTFGKTTTDPLSRYMQLGYQQAINPGHPFELTHTYSMAPTMAESAALAHRAEDSYESPNVTLSGPAVSSVPNVTVTGTATDNTGVTSLTVAGSAVPVAADGTWSRVVTLVPGANAITARATDGTGNASEATITLTYGPATTPTKPVPCVVPKLAGLRTPSATIAPLRKAGCTLGKAVAIYRKPIIVRKGRKVTRVVTKRYKILGTKQKAGRRLAAGAKVDLIVQGPKPKKLTPAQQVAAKKKAAADKKKKAAADKKKKSKPPTYKPDLPAR